MGTGPILCWFSSSADPPQARGAAPDNAIAVAITHALVTNSLAPLRIRGVELGSWQISVGIKEQVDIIPSQIRTAVQGRVLWSSLKPRNI